MKKKTDPPGMFPPIFIFQKSVVPQIFERWSSNRIMEGNVEEGSDFAA